MVSPPRFYIRKTNGSNTIYKTMLTNDPFPNITGL